MGKVYRADRKSVQRIKAREIVPGDIVEISGTQSTTLEWLNLTTAVVTLDKLYWQESDST